VAPNWSNFFSLFRYHAFSLILLYDNPVSTLYSFFEALNWSFTTKRLYHPTPNDSGTHPPPPPNPSLIRTHGSCGQYQLDEPAASCAASTSHRTSPFALSPRFHSVTVHSPLVSFIRIAIINPTPLACLSILPWDLDFPRGNDTHVPNFRVASNQPAQHCTAQHPLSSFTFYISSPISTLLLFFILTDKTTLQQSDAITSLLSLSIAAADDGALPIPALPEHTPGSGVAQSLGAASSMLTATTNTAPILPTSLGMSAVGKHHRRLGSMGKTKRRLSDAREASVRPMYVSLSLLFFACFLSLLPFFFLLCWCIFPGFPFLFLVFFFTLDCLSLVLSFLSLLVPPLPFKNVFRFTVVLRFYPRLHLSPQQCLAF
jgi:hypothetical protein